MLFEQSYEGHNGTFTTSNSSEVQNILGYYALQNGFSRVVFTYLSNQASGGIAGGFHDYKSTIKSPSKVELAIAGVGAYDNFGHNHSTYRTTRNVEKAIYKPNGQIRSSRAANYAAASKLVKWIGFGTGIYATGVSYNNIITGNGSPRDYADAGVGTVATADFIAARAFGYSVPGVGTAAGIYGAVSASYDIGQAFGPSTWFGMDNSKWFE